MLFTVALTLDEGRQPLFTNVDAKSKDEVKEILDDEYYPREVTIHSITRTIVKPNPDLAMED